MIDLDRIEAFYAPKLATANDDPTDCPRCHVTVAVRDGEEWAPDEGDYCDHCEREIARTARADVPALVAELRAARAEIGYIRSGCALVVGDVEHETAANKCDLVLRRLRDVEIELGESKRQLDAARAEIERLRTAADERADAVAWLRGMTDERSGYEMRCAMESIAHDIERGAHVGAAKGGEHG